MIPLKARERILSAVEEARSVGVRMKALSDVLELSERTIQRWKKELKADGRKGAPRLVPHKLTDEERREVIKVCCSERFKDMYPPEIVAKLAEEGRYIASESTFYRILKKEKLLSHRRKSRSPIKREKPRVEASGPDQVYSWDISWLKTPV